MDPAQGAPPAQPAAAAAPPVLPTPLPPPPALPAAPAPPAFALGPGHSHAILNYHQMYNKAISPLEEKFDGEADNLAVFLASIRDRARHFNWHHLITMPIDDGTT